MKITDGKSTVEISMHERKENGLSPDWSNDFFEAGGLPYDDDAMSYIVDDVKYCIDQAEDWKNRRGDFYYDESDVERLVFVF